MRGTSKISNSNALYYLNRNYNSLMKVQEQISSNKRVINLEDDPISANIGVRMNTIISRTKQYNRNIDAGKSMLRLSDTTLGEAKALIDKAKSLTVGAASDTTTNEQRKVNANEVNALLKQMITMGNRRDGDRYLFGGLNTTKSPFEVVNGKYVLYRGDDKHIDFQVDYAAKTRVNATGTEAFGNMNGKINGKQLNAQVNMGIGTSTKLAELNNGDGVAKGKIKIYWSAFPKNGANDSSSDGLEIDLTNCDTLEDVKDTIENETLKAARKLNPNKDRWLDPSNLNWKDLTDRYVKVTINPDHNGITLQEVDLGEPLPVITNEENEQGLKYNGINPATGNNWQPGDVMTNKGPVYNQKDYVYTSGLDYNKNFSVEEVANNKVAGDLGIKGSANIYDKNRPDPKMDGFLHGKNIAPKITKKTLLADIDGYNNQTYTITNGAIPGEVRILETSQDPNDYFSNWRLNGLVKGYNAGENGELYSRVVRQNDNSLTVEIYKVPIENATASDLVAVGNLKEPPTGGNVTINPANSSGVSGTVNIKIPATIKNAKVNLQASFDQTLRSTINVPAFKEQSDDSGKPKDFLNIFSGWSIKGLDKPISPEHALNHLASTDLKGNVAVNYRMIQENGKYVAVVELYRPSFADQPAKLMATGKMEIGDVQQDPTKSNFASGRVEFVGTEEFPQISGSVYLEIPENVVLQNGTLGESINEKTTLTYKINNELVTNNPIHLGGAMTLVGNTTINSDMKLAEDTLFKKSQVFSTDINLPGGGVLPAGTPLPEDTLLAKGTNIPSGNTILNGTVLQKGQVIQTNKLEAGNIIPQGSWVNGGFPADNMIYPTNISNDKKNVGFNLEATFATVEDLCRNVDEAGIHVTAQVQENGKGIQFISNLAGAHLLVSEKTDCYEQMNDKYQQLRGLDLDGLVKGYNTSSEGNLYTEVIFYPPIEGRPNEKVRVTSKEGKIIELDPGYYVRVYKDKNELLKPYEDRDNTKMVAEGFLPQPDRPNTADPNNPFGQNAGIMKNMILEERNQSGVSGKVDLNYFDNKQQVIQGTNVNDAPYNNQNITIFPGGLRPDGSIHTNIQQININSIVPGKTCDFNGTFHGKVNWNNNTNETTVELYVDKSRKTMSMKGTINQKTGTVELFQTDKEGNWLYDNQNPPQKISMGSIQINQNNLLDGQTDEFVINTGAMRDGGYVREKNVFATLSDIIDAMNENNTDKLHDLIGSLQNDLDRILGARGDVGNREKQLEVLKNRHDEEVVDFSDIENKRVGLDYTEAILRYQAATNAFESALRVSGQFMKMSLLDYL